MSRMIEVLNAQDGLAAGLMALHDEGVRRQSRNGDVLVLDGPTLITYDQPRERVVFWDQRDANPFFHFFESLWMLAGREDVAYVSHLVKRMATFSDDGKRLHGAYGYRWRRHFGKDQLAVIARRLRENPDDRRCVLGMWDTEVDLDFPGKDLPCNTHAYVQVGADGRVDLTVCNRSNDAVWGAFGANVVHFTVLHEVLSAMVGRPMGRFVQFTQNLHGYVETAEPLMEALHHLNCDLHDPYSEGLEADRVEPYPMVGSEPRVWLEDLELFMREPTRVGLRDGFFTGVACPLWQSHEAYKELRDPDRFSKALDIAAQCKATDWRRAAVEWLRRRQAAHTRAQDDGVPHG